MNTHTRSFCFSFVNSAILLFFTKTFNLCIDLFWFQIKWNTKMQYLISIHLNYKQLPLFNMAVVKDLNLTFWPLPLAGTTTMYLYDISDVIDVLTSTMKMFLSWRAFPMLLTMLFKTKTSLILQATVMDLLVRRLRTVIARSLWTTFESNYRRQSTHQPLVNNIFWWNWTRNVLTSTDVWVTSGCNSLWVQ